MNILEFISKESEKTVEKLTVEYKGQVIDFHIKNMSQADTEKFNGSQASLLPIHTKQTKGEILTTTEAQKLFAYESNNSYQLLCKEDGSPLFPTHAEFVSKIKGAFLKAVNKRVAEHSKEFQDEAEKN